MIFINELALLDKSNINLELIRRGNLDSVVVCAKGVDTLDDKTLQLLELLRYKSLKNGLEFRIESSSNQLKTLVEKKELIRLRWVMK